MQRTITESSAGRVVGELTTVNVWLEKIYGAVSGWRRGGVPGGGLPIQIENVVVLDGAVVARSVSQHQAASYQNQALLNGNASLRG